MKEIETYFQGDYYTIVIESYTPPEPHWGVEESIEFEVYSSDDGTLVTDQLTPAAWDYCNNLALDSIWRGN